MVDFEREWPPVECFYPPLPALLTGTPRARILAALATGEADMHTLAIRADLDMAVAYTCLTQLLGDGLMAQTSDKRGYAVYRRVG